MYLADVGTNAWLTWAIAAQTAIDADRQTLTDALDIHPDNFVEIPVVFGNNSNRRTARSGDSVNMLIINNGGLPCCLIPKPFGPVINGSYAFERAIELYLAPYGNPTLHFINCWSDLHRFEGEIHCGTNQIPQLRVLRWWEAAPP